METAIDRFLTVRRRKGIFLLYNIALILLATLPLNSNSNLVLNHSFVVHIRLDHLLHGIMFLPWVIIALKFKQMSIPAALVSGLLMAMMIEGIQYFLPYRAFNINDMLSNLIGVILGCFVLFSYGKTDTSALTK